ncbi:hypothetical protein skT53_00040 [Effusibacillus dendaii]|uniref:Uncharacterized protein n=1 Tax=Effusibacillus dendaii TaxID=2743772 RepID=A0A7I8D7N0_9BACL|nr:hypothetical protein skT53_00040 [Effusibacillus dendaii]
MLRIAATVHGYIDGIRLRNHDGIFEIEEKVFGESYFKDVWKDLRYALQGLHMIYPNWSSIDDLRLLASAIIKTWSVLGIFPRELEDGSLYIMYLDFYATILEI